MLGFLGKEATNQNAELFDVKLRCKRCGQCCQGKIFGDDMQYIIVFPGEISRLAETLKLSKKQFKEKHTFTKDGRRFIKLPCPFYDSGCLIYRARPLVCREFPLNQTYIKNGRRWMTVNMDCPAGKELGEKYATKVQV